MVTRALRWPGGALAVNADTRGGYLEVRVSDHLRRIVPGFDFDDGARFRGDRVRHLVRWRERAMDALAGQIIRLEFRLRKADLYTFCAVE